MASIKFKGVVKTYEDGVTVIPSLDLEIKDKEFVILVGPSGCGKSTTLRMIAGLEEISGGELYIGDELVNDVAPKNRDIAMVFQSYALYPHLSVYKNMAFALRLRKVDRKTIDEKVHAAAKILDIEKYLNRKPRALSGGQRQRVALGRAMVREPKVFLLDEPLSNLDAKLRTEMRSQIARLHKELQTTFVYVTHDQTEAMTMADRIVVMRDGVIQQADTPHELYNHPINAFVAGFIGSPQMNFINSVVKIENSRAYICFGSVKMVAPARMYADLKSMNGHEIILGIRPEDLHGEAEFRDEASSNKIKITAESTEMLGAEMNIYSHIAGAKIIARVSGDADIDDGDSVTLFADVNKLHIFDKETEILVCD